MAAVLPYGFFVFFCIAIFNSEGAQYPPFIITEPSVAGWKGDDIKLPCNFSGDPYAVFWVKLNGTDLNNKENKAGLFNGFIRSFDERFKMDDDFTIVIRDLQVSDEGEYLCQLEREDHSDEDSLTNLHIYGPIGPSGPMGAGAIAGIIIAIILIVVIIVGFLVWKLRRGKHNANDSADGKNEPAGERHKMLKLEADITKLRIKIKEYNPGKAADVPITADYVSKVNINLFGLMGAGKSSFFNSLNFAVKGIFEEISPEGCRAGSAKTKERTQTFLGNCVRLNDNRGLQNFETSLMEDVDDQVRGKRGVDPTVKVKQDPDNEIHCVIFVYEYNQHSWNADNFYKFIDKFFTETFYYYGRYPLFVFTHGDSIGDIRDKLISKLSNFSVPEENVRVFENYTTHNHVEDAERSLQFLEFIWKALIHCDHNINHVDRKRKEQPEEVQKSIMQKMWGLFGY